MRSPISLVAGILFALVASGQGIITTVAGNSTCCNGTDGAVATSRWLTAGNGLALDPQGHLYFYETSSSVVRKITIPAGILTTYAGNRTPGFSGDGGPATAASLFPNASISGIAFDSAGNLFIADGENHRVRKVTPAGIISTYAGNGTGGFAGDGGPATSAQLFYPAGLAVDSAGNLYIADSSNNRVRKVTPAGVITTYAGNGNVSFSGDNVQATTTAVDRPEGLTVDAQGNLYISETSDSRVRKVTPEGIISTVAGRTQRTNGFSGDGGPATAATLSGPLGLAVDRFGNLYIADSGNSRIRKVDATGIINTIAGINGNASTPLGDNGPPLSAFLGNVRDLVLDSAGNLYLSASAGGSMRVRKITASSGSGGFVAVPDTVSFTATTGGTAPSPRTINITATGGAVAFTATATSTGNWLGVSPPSGTTPAPLTVSVTPAGLGAGTYQGVITLRAGTADTSPLTINVTLTVGGSGSPAISAGGILNATGYQSRLAPGAVFVVFGSNMGPASLEAAAAPSYPNSLGGTSISFTPAAGGAAVAARIIYTLAGQVAGLLPSSIPPGTYAVRVTYNGLVSPPQNVTVVARSYGIAAANSAGSGLAQATIANVNNGLSLTRFTPGSVTFNGFTWTLSPAHPGDTLVLWGTGGGADAANDTGGSGGDQTAQGNFRVLVQGRQIVPMYAGTSSGYPGLWQINFTLPNDIALDCFASVQVSAGGEIGNTVIIPIAAAGQTACEDSSMPPGVLSKLDAGGTIVAAVFAMAKLTDTPSGITQETASGSVFRFTAAEWMTLNSGALFGACRVYDRSYPQGGKDPGAASSSLDAGAQLPVAGPGLPGGFGLARGTAPFGPFYSTSPGAGTLREGTYTLTGPGGPQVGPFSTSTVFPASFTATNWNTITSIDRTRPLTLTWTGSGFDKAAIVLSTAVLSAGTQRITTINCMVPGQPGTYTIPAAALAYLSPASTTGTAFGSLSLQGVSAQGTFTANLTGGGQTDIGTFQGNLGVGKNIAVQ